MMPLFTAFHFRSQLLHIRAQCLAYDHRLAEKIIDPIGGHGSLGWSERQRG
jgi:hypothetical protein